ncbi:MAG: nuclear transport factor 2 family protein [Deltaproteobacteria bacterium]|nr:nuclear transport factor 2 family protein [Deltaproteobacteria bacterium]
MNDLEAIRRLLALYPQLLDAKRLEEWGGLFTEDAIFDVFGRRLTGRAEIVREIGAMQPATPLKHGVFAPVVELDDVNRARAWTDFVTFVQGASGISIGNFATYHDVLAKSDGRWRIAYRAIVSAGEIAPKEVGRAPGF